MILKDVYGKMIVDDDWDQDVEIRFEINNEESIWMNHDQVIALRDHLNKLLDADFPTK